MSFDVLEEAEAWSHVSDGVADVWPEMSWVIGSLPLARCGERLARIPRHKEVHLVTKGSAREGFKIRPDRCAVQESRFHLCDQVRDGEGFDLTKSDKAQTWDCSAESEMYARVSCTKLNGCEGSGDWSVLGMIHKTYLLKKPRRRESTFPQPEECRPHCTHDGEEGERMVKL